MSQWLVGKATSLLSRRSTRRDFLGGSALVGTALAVAPVKFMTILPWGLMMDCRT